ncbi:MAG TPA: hypothetical protein VFB72_16255 [Verrucomicrobiae bacterium]|nr:hypothetical protein [Verrucomicrobiae bacterium]
MRTLSLRTVATRLRVSALFSIALMTFFATAPLRAEDPATFKVGDFTFTRPAKWQWVEVSSPMRKAQLKIADGDKSADVVFYDFGPGGAGGVQANVQRWLRQFDPRDKEKVNETTIGKTKVTYVQAEGTFHSGMPGGPTTPMEGYALMGAIIESDNGDVFVKLTGPKALVEASVAHFKKMIESGPKKD